MINQNPAELESTINPELMPEPVSAAEPKDIYILLQGSAHIKPFPDDKLEVTFLDDAGNRKPKSITFNLKIDDKTGLKVFKAASLDLIIECDKAKYEDLKQQGVLNDYFPKTFYEITETDLNAQVMNPPDPPLN